MKQLIILISILLLTISSYSQKYVNNHKQSTNDATLIDKLNYSHQFKELTTKWDTIRPLANPDKGWYHHMLDNGIGKYLIQDEKDLINFSGMDHLYLRLAWAYLEPEEGVYNWAVIDTIIDKYVPQGYGISFRISCKETGWVPNSIPLEIDGVGYATPPWVRKAGAKGIVPDKYGPPIWTPDWDDPIFLEKLNNFHKAFAQRYDGKPWLRYVDVGSIGEWGEGNAHRSTNIAPTVEEVKANIDIYLKNYKHSQLVATDALLMWKKSEDDAKILYNYAVSHGITLRDDSPMVKGHMKSSRATWSISHPHFYDPLYLKKPIIHELQHYGEVKEDGHWKGKNGAEPIDSTGVTGSMFFRKSIEIMHATYIGFHGYMGEWLTDNPDLTKELLNICGYWYFPKSIDAIHYKKGKLSFEMEWLNKGVAPAYNTYQLKGKLIPTDGIAESIDFEIENSGNMKWMPGKVSVEKYELSLSQVPKGEYWIAIQLFDRKSDKPVEIGLLSELMRENYFLIQKQKF